MIRNRCKTRLIVEVDQSAFERRVNEFICDKHIVDIQYSATVNAVATVNRAFIVYVDNSKNK